ncbi:MAG: DUF3078 domain-containing protein [Chitinophagales bacterium]|nr:DUF3078 domain-containing protein [Bacteroidota bacterium]
MKKSIFILSLFLSLSSTIVAQSGTAITSEAVSTDEKKKLADTTDGWKFGGIGGVTFNQAGFKNWAAGGTNSFSLLFNMRFNADMKKKNHLLQMWAAAEYGLQFTKGDKYKFRKNADRWEIFAKYGYKVYKPLYVAMYADLRSQFSNSYNYTDSTKNIISRAAAPLIFEGAIGLDYVPAPYFSLFFSPIAAKVTYVGANDIAILNSFGNVFPSKVKKEFGAVLIATYKQEFWKQNISILSVLKAYKNYLRSNADPFDATLPRESKSHYRKNIDVDWQTTLGLKVNKFLSASVFMHLIWDNDVTFPTNNPNFKTSKVQFRDIIGVGLTYQMNYSKMKGEKAKKI